MRSSLLFTISTLALFLAACSSSSSPDQSQDHIIGTPLTAVSSMTSDQGSDENTVVLYDSVVDHIHQFNLATGQVDRSLAPVVGGGHHNVLYDPQGNYIIDFSNKHMSIYDQQGHLQDQPLTFAGMPMSASFRPSMGYLVVYDNTHTVGILRLDNLGHVIGSWMSGPVVTGDVTIASGDINDLGQLVLGLSDNSMMVVDINQTLANQGTNWVVTKQFQTSLSDIKWLAPVHDQPQQMLLLSEGQLALVDTALGQVIASQAITSDQVVAKTSKNYDPHLLISSGHQVDLVYAKNSQLHSLANFNTLDNVLSSRLNLAHDSWSVIDTTSESFYVDLFGLVPRIIYDDPNATKNSRSIKKFTASHLRTMAKVSLPDDAQLSLTESHIFELFPSPLGYAVNVSIDDGSQLKFRNFNKRFEH